MGNEDKITMRGVVAELFPSSKFGVDVQLNPDQPPHRIIATLSGKLRMNYIKILMGDAVDVEISPYDLTKGRIIWRHK